MPFLPQLARALIGFVLMLTMLYVPGRYALLAVAAEMVLVWVM